MKTNVNILQVVVTAFLCMFSVHVSDKTFWEHGDDSDSHRPLHHFDIKAETLVDGVCFPPDARLEFEHLWLVQHKTILKQKHHIH